MTLRALIVDDNAEFLATARRLLEREGVVVVGAVSSGDEAVGHARELDPDVILLDVELGDESGFEIAERLGQTPGKPRVVLISVYPRQDLEELLDTSFAVGFVSKSQLSARAISDVLAGRDPATA